MEIKRTNDLCLYGVRKTRWNSNDSVIEHIKMVALPQANTFEQPEQAIIHQEPFLNNTTVLALKGAQNLSSI